MSLFALIAALLLEQLHPLSSRKYLYGWLSGYAYQFSHYFNAGERRHGRIAWVLAVLPVLFVVAVLSWFLHHVHPVLSWVFNVLVLYMTMGFRQFSHYFNDIHQALRDDDLGRAHRLLSIWRGGQAHELNAEEVARVTIEEGILASHRNVFGVIVWFVLFSALGLSGGVGVIMYRLGQFLSARWGEDRQNSFGDFARQAFQVMEWLPVRMTAMTFAIVGDFEDTIYCWRTQAASWPDRDEGILLASGAGALGVRLGMHLPQGGLPFDRPELGVGDDADAAFLQSTIGLVWRSIVLWLLLLLLLTLASLVG